MSPINNQIQPGDFTLLSLEKQESFEPSKKFKESLHIAQSEICNYIRTILGESKKFHLSNLAHESGIAIQIVIFLSSYAQSYRELRQALQENTDFLRWIHKEWCMELVINIIKNDFESFELENIGEVQNIFVQKLDQREKDVRKEEEKIINQGYTSLCDFFGLEDNQESREILRNHAIYNSSVSEEIIEYCREKGLTSLSETSWHYANTGSFLAWYANKYSIATDPDSLLGLSNLIGIAY